MSETPTQFSILPKPQTLEWLAGFFDCRQLNITGNCEEANRIARSYVDRFESNFSRILKDKISCNLASDDANVRLTRDDGIDPEGYRLEILKDGVEIAASKPAGWFYGLQSFDQLLHSSIGNECRIPCLRSNDAPRFSWRGLHLDVCRHFFDVDFVKRLLDLMAIHKLNIFHWHLTEDQGWRIDIPSRPKLATISAWRDESGNRYGGWYSHDEIREVVEYAMERQIQVVPEIELPGHSIAALAAYPELACQPREFKVETEWGIFDDVYCAGNEQSFQFLEEVLDVTISLFPSDIVHIGGDECPKTRWKECPKCQTRMKENGLANEDKLQSWFVGRMVRFLQERGKRAIGWDEILEGGLADGALVMSWRGDVGGIEAARMGHDVVMSPTNHCYFDYRQADNEEEPGFHGVNTLRDVFEFNPVPDELNSNESAHILGGQGNIWTERMYEPADVEFMIIPRICALAEVLWSGKSSDFAEFGRRLDTHAAMLGEFGFRGRPIHSQDFSG